LRQVAIRCASAAARRRFSFRVARSAFAALFGIFPTALTGWGKFFLRRFWLRRRQPHLFA